MNTKCYFFIMYQVNVNGLNARFVEQNLLIYEKSIYRS